MDKFELKYSFKNNFLIKNIDISFYIFIIIIIYFRWKNRKQADELKYKINE